MQIISLRMLQWCLPLSTAYVTEPILIPFLLSKGISQLEYGISQIVFTAVLLCSEVPSGWLADKTSRKWCKVASSAVLLIALLAYQGVTAFWQLLLIRVLQGVATALITGTDEGMIVAYCDHLKRDRAKELVYQIALSNYVTLVLAPVVTFIAARFGFEAALLFGTIPIACAFVFSILLADITPPRVIYSTKKDAKTAVREIAQVVKFIFKSPSLRWIAVAGAASLQSYRTLSIIQTPLLLVAEVPLWFIGFAWAFRELACVIGIKLVGRALFRWNVRQLLLWPSCLLMAVMVLLVVDTNIWTMALYVLTGSLGGWMAAVGRVAFSRDVPEEIMSTAFSVKVSFYSLLYGMSVFVVSAAADSGAQNGVLANLLFFLPLVLLFAWRMPTFKIRPTQE